MAKDRKKWWYILIIVVFLLNIFITARPISEETVLKPRWISSLESGFPVNMGEFLRTPGGDPIPFLIGERYGYVGDDGVFTVNRVRDTYVSISEKYWAEYGAMPSGIEVMNPRNELVLTIENTRGYPLFFDDRIYIVGSEQNSITAIDQDGEELWTHDFPAPVTCVDAAEGLVLVGTLDGSVELLDASGRQVFTPFEPGGSRLSVILGCAISRDASRLAIISGIDEQRLLLLEGAGDQYRVIYHEFIGSGFRRPVHISFVNNDTRVAFEREGALGIYDIPSRSSVNLPLRGDIEVLDGSGGDRFLFVITSEAPGEKRFTVIRYPSMIVIDVPVRSENVFFARRDAKLYIGGDFSIASFELENR